MVDLSRSFPPLWEVVVVVVMVVVGSIIDASQSIGAAVAPGRMCLPGHPIDMISHHPIPSIRLTCA